MDEGVHESTEPDVPAAQAIEERDWVLLAMGFTRILWSIPLGLMLFTGMISVRLTQFFQLPSYVLGGVLYFWGIITLTRVHGLSAAWRRFLMLGVFLAFLLFYFGPFVFWWMRRPATDHFAINLFGLAFSFIWLLWVVNRLAEEVAARLGDVVFIIETRLCRWSVVGFMGLPLLVYTSYVTLSAARLDQPLSTLILDLRYIPYIHWIFAAIILPLTLTLTILWKTRQCALRQLVPAGSR